MEASDFQTLMDEFVDSPLGMGGPMATYIGKTSPRQLDLEQYARILSS